MASRMVTYKKAAATKQYFPTVKDRLGIKLNVTPKLAAVLSGHGKTGGISSPLQPMG